MILMEWDIDDSKLKIKKITYEELVEISEYSGEPED